MNWLISCAQRHTPSLLSGLLLYWEAVVNVCSEAGLALSLLSGSSLLDHTLSLSTLTPTPPFEGGGSPLRLSATSQGPQGLSGSSV
jgi:hypothetical protein